MSIPDPHFRIVMTPDPEKKKQISLSLSLSEYFCAQWVNWNKNKKDNGKRISHNEKCTGCEKKTLFLPDQFWPFNKRRIVIKFNLNTVAVIVSQILLEKQPTHLDQYHTVQKLKGPSLYNFLDILGKFKWWKGEGNN
jgi:hypothetical protein